MSSTMRVNAATIVGSILIILGIAALQGSFAISPDTDGTIGARIFPLIGASSILLLGILELVGGLRGKSEALLLTASPYAIFGLLALSLSYVWAISKLGYLLATGLAAPLAMRLFGVRSPLGLAIATIACPTIYHLIFFQLLGVFPPYGEWFDLLDSLQGY